MGITHVAREVLEHLAELHRLANAERQVDIRPPVFGGNAGRACEGASGDPRIASAARQQISPQPMALLRCEHRSRLTAWRQNLGGVLCLERLPATA